jgi:four helix bundle protein
VLDAAEHFAADVIRLAERIDRRRSKDLGAQLTRSASSIAANIAEASKLGTAANYHRQLRIALGSASETGSHLRIARYSELLPADDVRRLEQRLAAICKMLQSLMRHLAETQAREEAERRTKSEDAA